LILDSKAQSTYTAAPTANPGANRQRASADAVAAYLNTIRGYVSGNTAYTDCAINILNAWSLTVNQVPTGTDQPGLNGIFTNQFAMVGEILRIYAGGRWATADYNRFKSMMTTYLYPACHDFLTNHNGTCISHYWAKLGRRQYLSRWSHWGALRRRGEIQRSGHLLSKRVGMGSIMNAFIFFTPAALAMAGNGSRSGACSLGHWRAGHVLRDYHAPRTGHVRLFQQPLIGGAEYTAKYDLWQSVPYNSYNNCD